MRFFNRRGRDEGAPDPHGPRDAFLVMLSTEQAAAVARMAREEAAVQGREAVIQDGALHLPDGEVMGLHNLAAVLVDVPYQHWRPLVREHVGTLLRGFETQQEGPADPRDVYVRLRPVSELPGQPEYDPWMVLPGVAAMLAIDRPDVVVELMGDLDVVGGNPNTAYNNALANLRALPAPRHEVLLAEAGDTSSAVHLFEAADFFGAARMLVLDDLLARVGQRFPDYGVLLVVPNRHLLAVHVPTGPSLVQATNVLVNIGVGECESRPGPVSPHVFHLRPDGIATQFSEIVEQPGQEGRAVNLTVQGPIEDMFRVLGLLDE